MRAVSASFQFNNYAMEPNTSNQNQNNMEFNEYFPDPTQLQPGGEFYCGSFEEIENSLLNSGLLFDDVPEDLTCKTTQKSTGKDLSIAKSIHESAQALSGNAEVPEDNNPKMETRSQSKKQAVVVPIGETSATIEIRAETPEKPSRKAKQNKKNLELPQLFMCNTFKLGTKSMIVGYDKDFNVRMFILRTSPDGFLEFTSLELIHYAHHFKNISREMRSNKKKLIRLNSTLYGKYCLGRETAEFKIDRQEDDEMHFTMDEIDKFEGIQQAVTAKAVNLCFHSANARKFYHDYFNKCSEFNCERLTSHNNMGENLVKDIYELDYNQLFYEIPVMKSVRDLPQ